MEKVVNKKPLWQKCSLCHDTNFTKLDQFERHLYDKHRTVSKNNSYYCKYGSNGVCNGHNSRSYSESEYKTHIVQDHAFHIISVLPYHKTSNCKKISDEWNFYSASQSLSTVLNDPKQPRPKDFFTKIWGDKFTDLNPVPPSQHLPLVKLQNFQDYLKRISKKHKKHIELSKEEKKEEYPAEIRQQFPNLRLSKLTDGVSYNLSEVPLVFLESNFDLSNCETFFTVFPNIFPTLDYLTNIPMASIKLSHKSIQEKLIYYLDTVEVKIAQQVRSKSEAFFHIMTSHDALNEKISQSIQLAGQSRHRIRQVDEELITKSLSVLKNITTINNHNNITEKLKLMATVYHTQTTIQVLLSATDYVAALDLIYTTKDLLSKELSGVHCFRHLTSELNEIIKMIDAVMAGEFEKCSSADLNRPLVNDNTEVLEKDKFFSILMGMMRRKNWAFLEAYNKECIAAISASIKKSVIDTVSNSDIDHQVNQTSSLENYLHCLSANEWLEMLENCSHALSILLLRIKAGYDIMQHAANVSSNKIFHIEDSLNCMGESLYESILSEEDYKKVKSKLINLLNSVTKYTIEKYAQLVTKHSNANAEAENDNGNSVHFDEEDSNNCLADQKQLLRLNECIRTLSNSYIKVCSNQDVGYKILQTAMQSEASRFVKKYHTEKINKLKLILDAEHWRQIDVPLEFQKLVEYIQNTGKFSGLQPLSPNKNIKPNNALIVNGEKFAMVGTVLILFRMTSDYCCKADDINIAAYILLRCMCDLLREYNSRSKYLVLQAKAISNKTGLKKITCINLVLSLRALHLILWLMPHLQTHFCKYLEESQVTTQINRVVNEINKHLSEIEEKLLDIVKHIIINEMNSWEAKPPIPSKSFQNICKHICKLHDAIASILPKLHVEILYRRIHLIFKNILHDCINKMDKSNDAGPLRGIVSSELMFYIKSLESIDALPKEEISLHKMNDIW